MICPITNNWCRTNGCGEKCYKRDSLGYSTALQNDAKLLVISRASKIKKAKDIASKIFMLYDENDKKGHWELDKATDAIYAYIKELEQS